MDRSIAKKYAGRRKRKKIAMMISSISAVFLAVFILVAFMLTSVDRFTISTSNEPELSLSIDETREARATLLRAEPLLEAADIQYSDLPEDIEDGIGSKNTRTYFAYSFYLLGVDTGKREDDSYINYYLSMSLIKTSNDIGDAMRVMIIRDGERMIFSSVSKPIYYAEDHTKTPVEIGQTTPYWDQDHIALLVDKVLPGKYRKYTIVIWIDGWESDDSMKGGTFSASLTFSTNLENKERR